MDRANIGKISVPAHPSLKHCAFKVCMSSGHSSLLKMVLSENDKIVSSLLHFELGWDIKKILETRPSTRNWMRATLYDFLKKRHPDISKSSFQKLPSVTPTLKEITESKQAYKWKVLIISVDQIKSAFWSMGLTELVRIY